METPSRIRQAQSCAADPRQAAREFHAAVAQADMALVVFFCSSEYDLAALAAEMRHLFAGVTVVGCTTAGEIGAIGYRNHSLSGASFPASGFTVAAGCLDALQIFDMARGQSFVQDLLLDLERRAPQANVDNSFALLLIDGLSVREEPVARTLQQALGKLPLLGGSAGDGLRFSSTHVYFDGDFHADSATLVLVSTPLPFQLFKTQHFVASDRRVVVTAADAEQRLVREIDGRPAAEIYAELIGVDVSQLGPLHFAAGPLAVVIEGNNYIRSISHANADGSLSFLCAIDEGMVLRLARGVNLLDNLERTFAAIHGAIGEPQLVIGCDCILRRLEIDQTQLTEPVDAVLRHNKVIGFGSYGEQFGGVHVNQTFAGIAIGSTVKND